MGDEAAVSIYADRWLPRLMSFKVLLRPTLGVTASVCMLKGPTRWWNLPLIMVNFLPVDQQAILAFPSSLSRLPDSICWHFDHSGEYTVRSGYILGGLLRRGLVALACLLMLFGGMVYGL
ncbi:hypothetical protein ACOSQ4_003895 [Xanthoceras sorbifolium]